MKRTPFIAFACVSILAFSGCASNGDDEPVGNSEFEIVSACTKGSVLGFYAHGDDPLLFSNPTLAKDIASGKCVTILYATSGYGAKGDCTGKDFCREQRERASLASFAKMAGVRNDWSKSNVSLDKKAVRFYSLAGRSQIRVGFLGLPCSGYNYAASDFGTPLAQLLQEKKNSARTLDGSNRKYDHAALVRSVSDALTLFRADTLRTTNPDISPDDADPNYFPDDHPDHVTVAKIAREAVTRSARTRAFYYAGYSVKQYPPNLSAKQILEKSEIARTYSSIDPIGTGGECDPGVTNPEFGCDGYRWIRREHDQHSRASVQR